MKVKAAWVLAVVSITGLVLAPHVVAGKKPVKSTLTLEFEDAEYDDATPTDPDDVFSGKIKARKAKCESGRIVKLIGPGSAIVGTAETDAGGDWEIALEDPSGDPHFAKTAKVKKGGTTCKGAKSKTINPDDTIGPADLDQDGWFGGTGGDCDDTNPDVNPDAAEVPDTIDNDCDGQIDEGDMDVDFFSLPADCDDTDQTRFPGSTEVFDGTDDDCDGKADNLDFDEDGFEVGEDCDDSTESRRPGATETPGNGVDEDCDGIGDAGGSDSDGDGVAGGQDCDDTSASTKPGAVEIRDGKDQDCDGDSDDIDADGDGTIVPADCDDTDANSEPGRAEVGGDSTDNDCDGQADE